MRSASSSKLVRLFTSALLDEARRCEERDPFAAFGNYDEHHLSHVLARALEQQHDAWVVLEAHHDGSYGSARWCDLYAELPGPEDLWLEVKRGWHGVGEHWNSKPREQLLCWLHDLVRLHDVRPPARRAFVMLHYAQERVNREVDSAEYRQRGQEIAAEIRKTHTKAQRNLSALLPEGHMAAPDALAILEAVLRALPGEIAEVRHRGAVRLDNEDIVYRFLAWVSDPVIVRAVPVP